MATPTEFASREVQAFLRGPVGLNTFAFATTGVFRNGVQYVGLLMDFPQPQDNAVDDFGIQQGGGFTVTISDEPDDSNWYWLWPDGSRILWGDATPVTIDWT